MDQPASPRTPLEGHERYQMIRNLNEGSYGFVQVSQERCFAADIVARRILKRVIFLRSLLDPLVVA